jgi:hypothetical protein
MTVQQKIAMLESRKNVLEARGSHNNAIVKKTIRQIRKLQKLSSNNSEE